MKLNTENIKKGPLTTIVGLILIVAGVASVFVPSVQATWTEALIAISSGAALLFLNDGNEPPAAATTVEVKGDATINTNDLKSSAKSLAWLLVFFIAVSCNTIRVPANEDRASRVVAKNIRQNAAIFEAFPGIAETKNVGVTLPEIIFESDTVYRTVPDLEALHRVNELEKLLREKGDPEVIIKWRDYIDNRPPEYKDGVYEFNSELFLSKVILRNGEISNEITAKARDVQVPQATIREVKKTSVFDWSLRIVVLLGVIVVALLFVRKRGIL